MNLKYGEVYKVNIKGEKVKGIYLGRTVPRKKLKLNHVILVNKELGDLSMFSYCIVRFKKYQFDEEDNLNLFYTHTLIPSTNERVYLEELLNKI